VVQKTTHTGGADAHTGGAEEKIFHWFRFRFQFLYFLGPIKALVCAYKRP
jgi:hypothetical protein